jgi:hypothetical protein
MTEPAASVLDEATLTGFWFDAAADHSPFIDPALFREAEQIDASKRSAAAARAVVREMGGRVSLPGGKDLCPNCVAEGKQPE